MKTKYSVVLTGVSLSRIKAIQVMRQLRSLGAREAISLVQELPAVLVEGLDYDEAFLTAETLTVTGAEVEIRPTPREVATEEIIEVLTWGGRTVEDHCLVRFGTGSELIPQPLGPDRQPRDIIDVYGFDPLVSEAIVPYLLEHGAPVFVWDTVTKHYRLQSESD